MAKMFYSLEEAALKLGMEQDELIGLASTGQIQQFRDREKIMFKREQIDELAEERLAALDEPFETESGGLLDKVLDETIPLADEEPGVSDSQDAAASDSGVIDLITAPQLTPLEMPELDQTPADPIDAITESGTTTSDSVPPTEQETSDLSDITQIADSTVDLEDNEDLAPDPFDHDDDEELVLEQVGSGSGLLDLTRESDDTSLGTELLDEIYPSAASAHEAAAAKEDGTLDTMEAIDAAITSSSIFDGTGELDISTSGLENLQDTGEPSSVAPPSMTMPSGTGVEAIAFDYPGNGLGVGMLMAAIGCLLLTLIVVTYALMDVPSTAAGAVAKHVVGYSVGLLALAAGLGIIGMFLGKVQNR